MHLAGFEPTTFQWRMRYHVLTISIQDRLPTLNIHGKNFIKLKTSQLNFIY